jgi:hypothetical protein
MRTKSGSKWRGLNRDKAGIKWLNELEKEAERPKMSINQIKLVGWHSVN